MTDFVAWLDSGNEPDNFEETYCLYHAALDGTNWGPYEATRDASGRTFIKGSGDGSLALVSKAAQDSFLRMIKRLYMDGDGPDSMEPEGWYAFMHAMQKAEKD
jgi:hypothetical protein